MDRSLKFYGELLGFKEMPFDYTGPLLGIEDVTGKAGTKAGRPPSVDNSNFVAQLLV